MLGLIQVGLTLYVRNTVVAAATEGARYAATLGGSPESGVLRARARLDGVVGDRFLREVSARYDDHRGVPVVELRIRAVVPPLGLWGPGVGIDVSGHGVREVEP